MIEKVRKAREPVLQKLFFPSRSVNSASSERRSSVSEENIEDIKDLSQNELIIHEFKKINRDMRQEIRNVYRLLLFFVVLVVGISCSVALFCTPLLKDISDFHHLVFEPHRIRDSDMRETHGKVTRALGMLFDGVTSVGENVMFWSDVIDTKFQSSTSLNIAGVHVTPSPERVVYGQRDKISKTKPVAMDAAETLKSIQQCDQCIFQIERENADKLFKIFGHIRDITQGNGTSKDTLRQAIYNDLATPHVKEKIDQFMAHIRKATSPWQMMNPWAAKLETPKIITFAANLTQVVIDIIHRNGKCGTLEDIRKGITQFWNYVKDIPLGVIFEQMQTLIDARSVITFPFSKLTCGDSSKILEFHKKQTTQSQSSSSFVSIYTEVNFENDKKETVNIIVPNAAKLKNSRVIIGFSQRIGVLKDDIITVDHSQCALLKVIIHQDLGAVELSPISAINGKCSVRIKWANKAVNVFQGSDWNRRIESFDTTQKHTLLLKLKELSVDQHTKEFMFAMSKDIGGIALKVAQVLSLRADVVTSEKLRTAFREATDSNEAYDMKEVNAVLRKEYGPAKHKQFLEQFTLSAAFKAGSVGQMHWVTNKKTNKIFGVLKVTFASKIKKKWDRQWTLFEAIGSSNAIPIVKNIWETMRQSKEYLFGELDLQRESKFTKMARDVLDAPEAHETIKAAMESIGWSDYYLPAHVVRVKNEWSTTHLLLQDDAKGVNLKDWLATKPSFEKKKKVLRSVLMSWGYLAFEKRIVYSDPHSGNIMVQMSQDGTPTSITWIDWGQTDIFDDKTKLEKSDNPTLTKFEWFTVMKKLYRQMFMIYDKNEVSFANDVSGFLSEAKKQLLTKGGIYRMFAKQFLEPIDIDAKFNEMFMADIAGIMRTLGFETEHNSALVLSGLALSTLNTDERFTGAANSIELVQKDQIKTFPQNACLWFRALTGLSGMLNENMYGENGDHLLGGKTVVEMWKPLL